jgi:hypothetical protein
MPGFLCPGPVGFRNSIRARRAASARRSIASPFPNFGGCAWPGRSCIWCSAVWFSWSCCCADRSGQRKSKSSCSHELAILRRQPRRAPVRPVDRAILAALARALQRNAWASLSVSPATLLAGTASWLADAGRTRTGGRGDRRSIGGYRRSLFDSHGRTRAGATEGSSASCEGLASAYRGRRCGRSLPATVCRRRRSGTSTRGETSCDNTLRRRSRVISSRSRPPG